MENEKPEKQGIRVWATAIGDHPIFDTDHKYLYYDVEHPDGRVEKRGVAIPREGIGLPRTTVKFIAELDLS